MKSLTHEYYLRKMQEAHDRGDFAERDNYAKAAGVDVIKRFYMVPTS